MKVSFPAKGIDFSAISAAEYLERITKPANRNAVEANRTEILDLLDTFIRNTALLAPYAEISNKLTQARRKYYVLKAALVKRLEEARAKLSPKEDKEIVLDLIREGLARHLERFVVTHRQEVVAVAEKWWDKYAVPMRDIEKERDKAVKQLEDMIGGLGYGK